MVQPKMSNLVLRMKSAKKLKNVILYFVLFTYIQKRQTSHLDAISKLNETEFADKSD